VGISLPLDEIQWLCDRVFERIPQPDPDAAQVSRAKLIAHRGAWKETGLKENTLPAFRECLRAGLAGIEFDIRWTADDVPVVLHDSESSRVFAGSRITIRECRFSELRAKLPLIPSLEEIVQEFGKKLHLMIEIKVLDAPEHPAKLLQILSQLAPGEDYHLISLSPEILIRLRDFFPASALMLISLHDAAKRSKEVLHLGLGALGGHYWLMTAGMRKQLRSKGVRIGSGFPDSLNVLKREVSRNADWIFTNHPLRMAGWLSGLAAKKLHR